jgi:hypothetical protein
MRQQILELMKRSLVRLVWFALAFAGVFLAADAASGAASPPASAAAPSSVELAVTLKLQQPDQLERLIDAQSDPHSPLYAHFLTPAQFRSAFAPTAGAYAATLAALRRDGFRIERTSPSRTFVAVSASPAAVTRTFRTRFQRVIEPGAASDVALDRFQIPPELAAVAAVAGAARPLIPADAVAGNLRNAPVAAPLRPLGSSAPVVAPDGGYGPAAITHGYDFPVLHGFDGNGVTVADAVDNPVNDANVAAYLQEFSVKRRFPKTKNVSVPGGFGGQDLSTPDIDGEQILGVAPGVKYYAYYGSYSAANIVAIYDKIDTDDIADVVNSIFGICELNDALVLALEPFLAQGAAQGITFVGVQFGGPTDCSAPGLAPIEFPGGDNHSLAAGGSNLIEDAAQHPVAESALPASGGGVSLDEPLPAFQHGFPGVNPAGRNTPDLVIAGEVNSVGPAFYGSELLEFGGEVSGWIGGYPYAATSTVAGMLAEIEEMAHHRLGAFDKTLYRLAAATGYGAVFHDVATGCDGFEGYKPICARPGYDITSGIGSVDAYRLGELLSR